MKKILVAYFSHSGNTKVIADNIKDIAGGDIFEIKAVESYPVDYNTVVEIAKREQNANARPKLVAKVEDMDAYEFVFIGYPSWWGTMPMGVFTFLEAYDFSGKTIVPFCTHEGSGLGRGSRDTKILCPSANVLEGLAVRGSSVSRAKNDVSNWLQKFEIVK